MTDRKFISIMLHGGFLCKRKSRDKRFTYAVYTGNMNIVAAVSDKQYRRFIGLFKEKKDQLTLNLNSVRMLHGKYLAKQLYKQSKFTKS